MSLRGEARLTQLQERASRVIKETLAELPPPLAAEAEKVPCLLEGISTEDSDLLGLYENFVLDEVSPAQGPIILYLHAIEDYCRNEDLNFEDEVRLTFLHELGHHFGWSEEEIEGRGLG